MYVTSPLPRTANGSTATSVGDPAPGARPRHCVHPATSPPATSSAATAVRQRGAPQARGAAAPPVDAPSITRFRSSADCQRSAGSFSRQRITLDASSAGTSGRRRATDSGRFITCAASTRCTPPLNGGRPPSIS